MATKIIEFHNQQYFVSEHFFGKDFNSIVTVSHDGNAVLKAALDISIILGSIDVSPNELEHKEQLSRRLSTLPVKDKKEDAFAKFETSYTKTNNVAELEFEDSKVILLPVSDDCAVEVELELLANYNWLTIDKTSNQAVRLHKAPPAFDGVRWDSFVEQLRLEFLEGAFKGECSRAYFIEDLIKQAKDKVVIQKTENGVIYFGAPVKSSWLTTQRYG